MSSNNSWLRVLGIIVLALVVVGAVALIAYRVGLNQGAGILTSNGPQPPSIFSPFDGFRHRMDYPDGRGFHPMMRFGWHFFHPGFWLVGLLVFALILFPAIRVFTPATANQPSRRSGRKS